MMPPGVQDLNPFSSKAIAANDVAVTPSTSFVGVIASNTCRSSTWGGIGC
jgi:hypothetical protein